MQFLPHFDDVLGKIGTIQEVDSSSLSSPRHNFTHNFLKSILTSIDCKDSVVANAWLETLLDVIDLLPQEVIREEIVSLAVSKGNSQEVSSRVAACKIIGKIASKFNSYILKTEVIGVVQSLCQDVYGDVRGTMCMHLHSVAKGVGLTITKNLILPELVNLCSDEEIDVRLAGVNSVVQFIALVDQETRSNILVPLVTTICERSLKAEDSTLPVTANLLGRLCHGLHADMSKNQKEWFVKYYCTLSKLGLPGSKKSESELSMPDLIVEVKRGDIEAECRQQCSFNFPFMVVFAGGSMTYQENLHETFLSFINDPCLLVINNLALSFHQVCTLLGSEIKIMKNSFLTLLRSESIEVLSALVPNLSHVISLFNQHNVLSYMSKEEDIRELVGSMKSAEQILSDSSHWRGHSEMLIQSASLVLCVPPDVLFSELVPLMIHTMHSARPIPCRESAARTLLVYLRYMHSNYHKEDICKTLVTEFGKGKSCHKRMLFLSVCQMALELLSLETFRNVFFTPLIALYDDPVPNVRLKLVTFLPILKEILAVGGDEQKSKDFEAAVENLSMREKDRDVCSSFSSVLKALESIVIVEKETKVAETKGEEHPPELIDPQRKEEGQDKVSYVCELKESNSRSSSAIRRAGLSGKIPTYVADGRRKSKTFSPELPPDEKTIKSISNIDPTTDEFVVDAGIRIDKAVPQRSQRSTNLINRNEEYSLGIAHGTTENLSASTKFRSFGSKIPIVGNIFNETPNTPPPVRSGHSSFVKTRSRGNPRSSRPVSGVSHFSSSHMNLGIIRGKSLSQENLSSPTQSETPTTGGISSARQLSNTRSLPHRPSLNTRQFQGRCETKGISGLSSPVYFRSSRIANKMERNSDRRNSTTSSPSSPVTDQRPDDTNQQPNSLPPKLDSSNGFRSRSSPQFSLPSLGVNGKGRGSKLPLPTFNK